MTREQIQAIAAARDQVVIEVEFLGSPAWLMVDAHDIPCGVDHLAQCMKTDDWERWEAGKLLAFDRHGNLLEPEFSSDWIDLQPIRFFNRPKRSLHVCGRCGLPVYRWNFGWKHSGGSRTRPACRDVLPVRFS